MIEHDCEIFTEIYQRIYKDLKKKVSRVAPRFLVPRIFVMPKIQKENIPMRPIFDTIRSSTYPLANFFIKDYIFSSIR
jgi:hypothetical protein